MDEYYRAVKALPAWLAAPLAQLPAQTAVRVQELRLRIGCAVTFTVQGRQCTASVLPGCPPALAAMRLDALQIEEIFHTLCNGSVHTHERELAEGYLTTAAGNRVGVAGQFVQREGQSVTLQKVTSLNLRIARSCIIPLPPALDKLLEQHFTGLLIVGEPCRSGTLPPLYGKCDRTTCAQPQLLYARCRLYRQLCQRRRQPSGKGFDGSVILVHFGFSFHESFVLALYALCALLEPGTGKQKSPCNSVAEAFEIIYISAFERTL